MKRLKYFFFSIIFGGIAGLFLLSPDTSLAACAWTTCNDPNHTLCCISGTADYCATEPNFDCTRLGICAGTLGMCPSGYVVQCSPRACVTPTPIPTPTPTPTPLPTPTPIIKYINFGIAGNSISGNVFEDNNPKNGMKDALESNYTGGEVTVISTGGKVTQPGNTGEYKITGLSDGSSHTVTFSLLASSSYRFTYPLNPLTVTVGTGCVLSEAKGESCVAGSIKNLNAGVTNARDPWFQSVGSDIRWDNPAPYPVPPPGQNASLDGLGRMPGIIFTGKSNPFAPGQTISSKNWLVGDFYNFDFFTTSHNTIPTSYDFLLETALGSGIEPVNLVSPTNYCGAGGIGNCTLSASLPNGIYIADGNLKISNPAYSFPLRKNFIILVKGNLTINGNIAVPGPATIPGAIGSTAIFSASENITVGASVTNIQGLYSADGTFKVETAASCQTTADFPLNIEGTVIANAGRSGGTFDNRRTLCGGNATSPSVTFTERPDFMLNYPSMVKRTTRIWQEVAP